MNNAQVSAARRVLFGFPMLGVSITKSGEQETLTPYLKSDPSSVGNGVAVTAITTTGQLSRDFNASCAALAVSNG